MESERSQTAQGSQIAESTEQRRTQPPQSHVLKLRGDEPKQHRGGVRWEEGTVDNENMGKKKSKICCIYHKPKRFDESSDESDCSDSEHHHSSNCNLNKYDNPSHPHNHVSGKGKDKA